MGKKSVPLRYDKRDQFGMHSHPGETAMSRNIDEGVKSGDIAHVLGYDKNLFMINSKGDIFYTNVDLAAWANENTQFNDASKSQVYLGNIRDYLKAKSK